VAHVGALSGVCRKTSDSSQESQTKSRYELFGAALDVCRLVISQTSARVTDHYAAKVTKDAVDEHSSTGEFDAMTLVPDISCFTVKLYLHASS